MPTLNRRITTICVLLCLAATIATGAGGVVVQSLKYTSIDVPGARSTNPAGINNLGEIVGSWEDSVTRSGHGFLYSAGVYSSIDVPGAMLTVVSDINDAGDMVGTYYLPALAGQVFGDVHGFLLTAGGQLTTLTFPNKRVTSASAINNLGQIVGGYSEWDGDQVLGVHGFLLEDGVFAAIDFPVPVPRSHVMVTYTSAINDAGDIVGGYNEDNIFESRRGFVFRDGVFSTLNVPESTMTDLYGTNNRGEIVGEYSSAAGSYTFAFSSKLGFRRLGPSGNPKRRPGVSLAVDINDWGQIVGSLSDGSLHGFLASPPRLEH